MYSLFDLAIKICVFLSYISNFIVFAQDPESRQNLFQPHLLKFTIKSFALISHLYKVLPGVERLTLAPILSMCLNLKSVKIAFLSHIFELLVDSVLGCLILR